MQVDAGGGRRWAKVVESGYKWIQMEASGYKWMQVDENIRGATSISDAFFLMHFFQFQTVIPARTGNALQFYYNTVINHHTPLYRTIIFTIKYSMAQASQLLGTGCTPVLGHNLWHT